MPDLNGLMLRGSPRVVAGVAWAQGRATACLDWAEAAGFSHVEVSRGTVEMELRAKRELIRTAASLGLHQMMANEVEAQHARSKRTKPGV